MDESASIALKAAMAAKCWSATTPHVMQASTSTACSLAFPLSLEAAGSATLAFLDSSTLFLPCQCLRHAQLEILLKHSLCATWVMAMTMRASRAVQWPGTLWPATLRITMIMQ